MIFSFKSQLNQLFMFERFTVVSIVQTFIYFLPFYTVLIDLSHSPVSIIVLFVNCTVCNMYYRFDNTIIGISRES